MTIAPLPTSDRSIIAFAAECPCPPPADEQIELAMVPVRDLRIDPSYQRQVSSKGERVIRQMLQQFDWARFGALTVTRRGDHLAVVDGQHRAIAASLLGIQAVPAVVCQDAATEAADFVEINDTRTSVSPADKFRARCAAGDPEATELASILTELGITIAQRPGIPLSRGETRAITQLQRLMPKVGRGVLFTALELLKDGQDHNPEALTSLAITAVTLATDRVIAAKGDIDRLARVIEGVDMETLEENARQLAKIKGGKNTLHAADLLMGLYGKGLRKPIEEAA